MTDRIRHAVSRQTGATTYTRKVEDKWVTTCLNHSTDTSADARGPAWKNGSTPGNWCPKCKAIAAGKADKITGDRLDPPTEKKATPARKTAAPKGKPTAAVRTTPAKKAAAK